jgi:hypothetical protein
MTVRITNEQAVILAEMPPPMGLAFNDIAKDLLDARREIEIYRAGKGVLFERRKILTWIDRGIEEDESWAKIQAGIRDGSHLDYTP